MVCGVYASRRCDVELTFGAWRHLVRVTGIMQPCSRTDRVLQDSPVEPVNGTA